ncbi:MurR/RpiR family transcriptional regulator [Bacillus sp. FJAT-27245]|uniref:MurR/RpiR family transcriptional regulator n=1 Tax=Bacillus sp. FJAT-27245 TaxID=1684144 RepID=UPI001E5E4DF5|nr:MurR/RpiR family transcriptional regulator [Bacillus sp. FJAT-27245]
MSTTSTTLKIKSYYTSLTKAEKKAADYIVANLNDIIYCSVTELAEKADVGETTVLRLCRKIGFTGFQDFKLAVAQDSVMMAQADESEPSIIRKTTSRHVEILEESRQLLDEEQVEKAVQAILSSKNNFFFGVGSSGLTALQAVNVFTRIGIACDAKQDSHFQAMSASLLTEEDCAIGLSVSGSTKDTIRNLELAKKAGARIICITSNGKSPITKLADIVLLTSSKEGPLEGSSIVSQIAQLSVIDILHSALINKREDIAQTARKATAKAVSDKLY